MWKQSDRFALTVLGLALAAIVVFTTAGPAMADTRAKPVAGTAADVPGLAIGLTDFELDGNAITHNVNPGVPDDWDRLYANNGSSHQLIWTGVTPDTDGRTYKSGSTDLEDFPALHWDFGSVPPKADIQNSYVAVYQDNHIYFGADRLSATGNSYLGFWLLQNPVSADPGGGFTGNRTVGDVLILANFGGGGKTVIAAYKWVGGAAPLSPLPIDADKDYAIVNTTSVSSPWPYPLGATAPYTFPAGAFFEGGADLADMGITGCFAYFLTETRSSSSLTSELKNFVLGRLPTKPAVHVTPANQSICVGDPAVTFCAGVDSGTGAPPFTYAWTGPGGFTSTDTCITVGAGFAAGTYVYRVVVTGCNFCASDPVSDTLTVNVVPSVSIDGPSAVCPSSANGHCGPVGMASYLWSISGNGSIVGPANGQCVQVLAGSNCAESYNLTLRTGNASGCSGVGQKSVTVNDTGAPVITCPANITIQCTESIEPGRTGTATATDNCDATPTITNSDVTTAGSCPQSYAIARTWRATDDCGNSATCVQTITVRDSQAPSIACPANITIQCTESIEPGRTGTASATDNCDATPTITNSDVTTPGSCPQSYAIARTWVAVDDCANWASCTQTITVRDTTDPDITCPSDIRVAYGESTEPSHTGSATATDNCDPSPRITYGDQILGGPCPQSYSIARTWVATDACGNEDTCIQTITVSDITLPVITCPSDITVQCTESTEPGH
ncbi:MAG: hypothetical protein V1694_10605, partial [Candidatus Eisenbacteria bacterium]